VSQVLLVRSSFRFHCVVLALHAGGVARRRILHTTYGVDTFKGAYLTGALFYALGWAFWVLVCSAMLQATYLPHFTLRST
jgi:hypothetical protein